MKVARLSALRTGRLYLSGDNGEMDGVYFFQRLEKFPTEKLHKF
jgi:hypothetical protein